jgi:hypothetical protein
MSNGEDPRLNRVKEILVSTLERRMSVSAGCKLVNYLYLAKQVGEEADGKKKRRKEKRIRCEHLRWDEVKEC